MSYNLPQTLYAASIMRSAGLNTKVARLCTRVAGADALLDAEGAHVPTVSHLSSLLCC